MPQFVANNEYKLGMMYRGCKQPHHGARDKLRMWGTLKMASEQTLACEFTDMAG